MDRIAEKKTKAARSEELSAEEAKASRESDKEDRANAHGQAALQAAAAHKGAPADAYAQTGEKKADDDAAVEEEEEATNGSEEEDEDEDEEEADEEAEDASEETDEKAKTE